MLLGNAEFLERLKDLFEARRNLGSVFLSQKRCTYDGTDHEANAIEKATLLAGSFPCLLRATDGRKMKISTLVQATEIDRFSVLYCNLLRSSFSTLRKRDKKKERQKKGKVTEIPKLPKIVGPRRGAGHAKRQASIKRRMRALNKIKQSR